MSDHYSPNPPPKLVGAVDGGLVCVGARSGWVWHCPKHAVHGTAPDADEAEFIASSHTYYAKTDAWDEAEQGCSTRYWPASSEG